MNPRKPLASAIRLIGSHPVSSDASSQPSDVVAEPSDALKKSSDVVRETSDALAEPSGLPKKSSGVVTNPSDAPKKSSDGVTNPSDGVTETSDAPKKSSDVPTNPSDQIMDSIGYQSLTSRIPPPTWCVSDIDPLPPANLCGNHRRSATRLAKLEGILPARSRPPANGSPDEIVVICLSGRGDKDVHEVARLLGKDI